MERPPHPGGTIVSTHPPQELRDLAAAALRAAGTSPAAADAVAGALIAAELDGIASHGLARVPFYADQVRSGKIDGKAVPEVARPATALVRVDAKSGFAFPAIEAGQEAADNIVGATGIVAVAIGNSHHCGVAGHHVERLAAKELIGILFANTPAAIAPWGGKRPLYGTNPIAFGCPRKGGPPLVVDLSVSVAARGKVMTAAQKGDAIPPGWALDPEGRPTTDPEAALKGSMAPLGGAKGAALALMVEILAAALTGAHFGFEASSFFDAEGPPPRVGQLLLVIDPSFAAGFGDRVEALCAAILGDAGTRLPGDRRLATRARLSRDGIAVPDALVAELRHRAAGA
jgi:(2R)-3-sulfolactate dehydrogenase (NADP+)